MTGRPKSGAIMHQRDRFYVEKVGADYNLFYVYLDKIWIPMMNEVIGQVVRETKKDGSCRTDGISL